jgi:hypothetical protein
MNKFISIIFLLCSIVFSVENECIQGHGGSFYFTPGFINMNLNPIADLATNDKALNSYKYKFSENIFALHGFGFYWGEKNKGRGGFSFQAGYRRYRSDAATLVLRNDNGDTLYDTTSQPYMTDSVMNLMVVPAYVMFQFDKSRSIGSLNLYGGGAIGGGAIVLIRSGEKGTQISAFDEDPFVNNDGEPQIDENSGSVAVAPLLIMEFHAGSTISMNKWLHIGMEGFVLGQYASDGFIGAEKGSFSQFLPGIRMRIILGSLG